MQAYRHPTRSDTVVLVVDHKRPQLAQWLRHHPTLASLIEYDAANDTFVLGTSTYHKLRESQPHASLLLTDTAHAAAATVPQRSVTTQTDDAVSEPVRVAAVSVSVGVQTSSFDMDVPPPPPPHRFSTFMPPPPSLPPLSETAVAVADDHRWKRRRVPTAAASYEADGDDAVSTTCSTTVEMPYDDAFSILSGVTDIAQFTARRAHLERAFDAGD